MKPILEGIKILDLSTLLPGPYCTQILADMGAEVIKVENPRGGDFARHMEPVGKKDGGQFLAINRNKKSMTLNLKTPEGKQTFLDMAKKADVVIEQYRPGVMEKLGVGYEALKAVNPGIVMLSISGFGQDGPMVFKAGHDINYLSQTGVLDLSGRRGERAAVPAVQMSDVGGGTFLAAFGVVSALFARERTGEGCHVDIALTDAAFAYAAALLGAYSINGRAPVRSGEMFNGGKAWYNIYTAKDGREIAVGMLEPKFWATFCKGIGREDFIELHDGPAETQIKMEEEITKIIATKTADEWMKVFEGQDVCASKVSTLAEAVDDEYLNYRGMIIRGKHPVEGEFMSVGLPLKFMGMDTPKSTVPPQLGENTDEVLAAFGYSEKQIADLRNANAI